MSGWSLPLGLGRQLPMIQQIEVAECGLACVAMISPYHGHKFDMGELRRRFPISSKGTTLETLVTIASPLCTKKFWVCPWATTP